MENTKIKKIEHKKFEIENGNRNGNRNRNRIRKRKRNYLK